jgi:hypothetical protein
MGGAAGRWALGRNETKGSPFIVPCWAQRLEKGSVVIQSAMLGTVIRKKRVGRHSMFYVEHGDEKKGRHALFDASGDPYYVMRRIKVTLACLAQMGQKQQWVVQNVEVDMKTPERL